MTHIPQVRLESGTETIAERDRALVARLVALGFQIFYSTTGMWVAAWYHPKSDGGRGRVSLGVYQSRRDNVHDKRFDINLYLRNSTLFDHTPNTWTNFESELFEVIAKYMQELNDES